MTLSQYLIRRLGRTPGEQARNFLARPFGAESLTQFWRHWNPVWGYYLLYYCYRPLRSYFPRRACVFITFVVCGLLHDMPVAILAYVVTGNRTTFTITTFFVCTGLLVVTAETIRIRFTRVPVRLRWIIHLTALSFCYWLAASLTAP